MTRQIASAYSWPAIITLMLAALSLNVAAAPCDPDESKWAPSRYYPAGAVVHHDGEWYQSRELHQGLEPGITFDWKQLDAAPECSGRGSAPGPDRQVRCRNRANSADRHSHWQPGFTSLGIVQ